MRGSSMVWRALEAARRRNLRAAGEPPPVPGRSGVTRRAVLRAMAAAAIPALPRPAHAYAGGRVAIVGGGIAGLSALHYLAEAGIDARLYEARDRLGGRMFTQRPANGAMFEAGGQLVNSDHADMHALAKAFGIALLDRKAEPHHALVLAGGRVVPEAELAEALRGIAGQIGSDSDALDKDYARAAPALDRPSAAAYLDRHAALIAQPWARRLLEASIRTEFGVEPAAASALELIFNLPTVDGARVELLGASDERYVLENGSGALPEAIAARHARRIETGRRLLTVQSRRGGLRLGFLDGSSAEAETLVVAVPAPILRQVDFRVPLPPLWRAYLAVADLGRNEKVQAAASATPWRGPMGAGGELWQSGSEGWSLGWEGSVRGPGSAAPVWTWYLGGDQVDADVLADALARRFVPSTEPAVPGLGTAIAAGPHRRTGWCRDPLTLGAYSVFAPGQLTRFAPLFWIESDDASERQAARAGRILFAGEHLSDAWAGFMNGGAQTGRLAAETLVGKALLAQAA